MTNDLKLISPFTQPPRVDGLQTAMRTATREALDFMGIEGHPTTDKYTTAALVAIAGTMHQSGDIIDQHVDAAGDLLMRAVASLERIEDVVREMRDDQRSMFKLTFQAKAEK